MKKKDNTPKTREQIFAEKADNYGICYTVGLSTVYYDMPGRMERAIKNHLIHVYSRKRYYEYHNGTRPMTPDVERYVRQTLKAYGWTQEPTFRGYVEDKGIDSKENALLFELMIFWFTNTLAAR